MTTSTSTPALEPTDVAVSLLAHWRAIFLTTFIAGAAAVGYMLVAPRTYTATTSIVPEAASSGGGLSQLLGVASQVGLLSGVEPVRSSVFYADLLTSRPILDAVLQTRMAAPSGGDSASLLDLMHVSGNSMAERLDRGYRQLLPNVRVDADRRTGIVRLSADARSPIVAAQTAASAIRELERFNGTSRHTQARARREFAEARVRESADSLRRTEDQLRTFYERNRQWRNSPTLTFDEGRIQRQVAVRQEVFLSLTRDMELSRIAEVNDIPVFTVIERAEPPIRHSKPHRVTFVLFVTVLALLVASSVAVVGDRGWHTIGLTDKALAALRSASSRGRTPLPPR